MRTKLFFFFLEIKTGLIIIKKRRSRIITFKMSCILRQKCNLQHSHLVLHYFFNFCQEQLTLIYLLTAHFSNTYIPLTNHFLIYPKSSLITICFLLITPSSQISHHRLIALMGHLMFTNHLCLATTECLTVKTQDCK